jgi:hypothetical protein
MAGGGSPGEGSIRQANGQLGRFIMIMIIQSGIFSAMETNLSSAT